MPFKSHVKMKIALSCSGHSAEESVPVRQLVCFSTLFLNQSMPKSAILLSISYSEISH